MNQEALKEMLRFFYTDQVHIDQAPPHSQSHLLDLPLSQAIIM